MNNDFKLAKWIWNSPNYKPDEYVEFHDSFIIEKKENIFLNISCDSNYVCFINDKLAAFGQYADYPNYKVYDKIDISKFCTDKINNIKIIVWYYGLGTQTYLLSNPGLIYEITCDNNVLCFSQESTLSGLSTQYKNHYNKLITKQIGNSFLYDATINKKPSLSFSHVVSKTYDLQIRPNKKLVLEKRKDATITKYDNNYLIDLGQETCGFIDLDFFSKDVNLVLITYGENLDNNGHVRRKPQEIMDYSVEYKAKKGVNKYLNPFRRIAGRYLEIFYQSDIDINYIGIRPTNYPIKVHNYPYIKGIRKDIYRVAVHTLHLCMHEHFEDCPWREQALYTMDSRNELLSSYYAFNDYEFARSNLVLISKGLRDDGLLSLCYPTTLDEPIPFFSLVYPIEVFEYISYSKDKTIINEVYPVIKKIITGLIEHIDETNLIKNYVDPPYWNFYEWTDGSVKNSGEQYDAILNCMFVYSFSYFKKLADIANDNFDFDLNKMKKAIVEHFYDKDRKLIMLSNNNRNSSVLANSFAILANIDCELDVEKIIKNENVIPVTLSMSTFFYDALLKIDENYKDFVIKDIDKKYEYMLSKGATSFWETLKGAEDIGGSGSLCHGWSSIPIYYYATLLKDEH